VSTSPHIAISLAEIKVGHGGPDQRHSNSR
jgi:hypothetical protein